MEDLGELAGQACRVAVIIELSHEPKRNPRQVAASCISEISPEGGYVSLLADSQDRAHVQYKASSRFKLVANTGPTVPEAESMPRAMPVPRAKPVPVPGTK